MNCDEFLEKLLLDPDSCDADFVTHRQQCEKCEQLYRENRVFEQKIHSAFRSSPQLSTEQQDQLLVRAISAASSQQRRARRLTLGAITALLLCASVFIAFQVYQKWSLNDFVLAHIEHEIDQLDNQSLVSQASLERLYTRFDSAYLAVVKQITYAERCWMRTGYGLHLILKGQKGPVTLLLMPNEAVAATMPVNSEQFQGKIYSLGHGSMALIGNQGEPVEMLAEKIRMAQVSAVL